MSAADKQALIAPLLEDLKQGDKSAIETLRGMIAAGIISVADVKRAQGIQTADHNAEMARPVERKEPTVVKTVSDDDVIDVPVKKDEAPWYWPFEKKDR